MSDFLRGNHSNRNSPYFESAADVNLADLTHFVEYYMEDEVLDYFLNNCSDIIADEYESIWLDDFPRKLCDDAVRDYVSNCQETAEQAYLNFS